MLYQQKYLPSDILHKKYTFSEQLYLKKVLEMNNFFDYLNFLDNLKSFPNLQNVILLPVLFLKSSTFSLNPKLYCQNFLQQIEVIQLKASHFINGLKVHHNHQFPYSKASYFSMKFRFGCINFSNHQCRQKKLIISCRLNFHE